MDQIVLEPEPKNLDTWSWSLKFEFRLYSPAYQARGQLGTPEEAKSFLRRDQFFLTMSNSFKRGPTHFSREGETFSRGAKSPLRTPGYGPAAYHILANVDYFLLCRIASAKHRS